MLAGAGLVLATTCCSAGGAAAAEVRPATHTANLVNSAAALGWDRGEGERSESKLSRSDPEIRA